MVELKNKHKTKVFNLDGFTCVQYWQTIVIKFNDKEIILNSNGYDTKTTKTRINQASDEFMLGVNVFQKDFVWYVNFKGKILEFKDNMRLIR